MTTIRQPQVILRLLSQLTQAFTASTPQRIPQGALRGTINVQYVAGVGEVGTYPMIQLETSDTGFAGSWKPVCVFQMPAVPVITGNLIELPLYTQVTTPLGGIASKNLFAQYLIALPDAGFIRAVCMESIVALNAGSLALFMETSVEQ